MSAPGARDRRRFERLLSLYPEGFRERWGDDARETFEDQWCEEELAAASATRRARFWAGLSLRSVRGGLAERWRARSRARAPRGSRSGRLLSELAGAARTLARHPGHTTVVVVTLALAMGPTLAVYGVLRDVVLAPLPLPESERLVRVLEGDTHGYACGGNFLAWRDQAADQVGLAALYTYRDTGADLTGEGPPRRIRTQRVSAGYFEVLGFAPLRGRVFGRDDELPGNRIAVLSHGFWRDALKGRSPIVGSALRLDGESWTVVGVMPPGARDAEAERSDVWLPLDLRSADQTDMDNHYLTLVGRLEPGAAAGAVATRLIDIQARLGHQTQDARSLPLVVGLQQDVVGGAAGVLLVLMAAVAVLLLIACVDVAQLQLARGLERQRELAVRAALGAERRRLVGRLLLESLMMAAVAALLAAIAGRALLAGLGWLAADSLPRLDEAGAGTGAALVFAAALLVALLSGLVPALRATRVDLRHALVSRGALGGDDRSALVRRSLVALQIGLAVFLMTGAGVLGESLRRLTALDHGAGSERLLTWEVSTPRARYATPAQRTEFHRRLSDRIEALNAVEVAGAVSWLPFSGHYHQWGYQIPERGEDYQGADQRMVEGHAFQALGLELLAGRLFEPRDDAAGTPVVVVSRALAERDFPASSAVGAVLRVAGREKRVVGVVSDAPLDAQGRATPTIYHPHAQVADDRNWSLVQLTRLRGDAGPIEPSLRAELAAMDPELVLHQVQPLSSLLEGGRARERLLALLTGGFAVIAGLLTTIGVYGVLAWSVERRRREIGVRAALGASRSGLAGLVVGEAARLCAAGLAGGTSCWLLLSRPLEAVLFDVRASEPSLMLATLLAVAGLAGAAALVPAWRATCVDPAEAMRGD